MYRGFLFVVALLLFIGFLVLFSITPPHSEALFGSPYYLIKKQFLACLLGLAGMVVISKFPPELVKRFVPMLFAVSLAAIVASLLLPASGPKRWIRLGTFSLQPIEMLKILLVLYFARYFSSRDEVSFADFLKPILITVALMVLVLVQPDFGSAVQLLFIGLFMSFLAGIRLGWLIAVAAPFVPALVVLIITKPYRLKRFFAFLSPWEERLGVGFQLVQSLMSIGAGGILGVGLGKGMQKLFFLPEAHTDFILACVGEEMGFVGLVTIVGLFVAYGFIGIRTSLKLEDRFDLLSCAGLTFMVVFQALLNMMVALGLAPTKGLPLPFISYGGSSLIFTLFATGYILGAIERSEKQRYRCSAYR